jgi:hypothetical protein
LSDIRLNIESIPQTYSLLELETLIIIENSLNYPEKKQVDHLSKRTAEAGKILNGLLNFHRRVIFSNQLVRIGIQPPTARDSRASLATETW